MNYLVKFVLIFIMFGLRGQGFFGLHFLNCNTQVSTTSRSFDKPTNVNRDVLRVLSLILNPPSGPLAEFIMPSFANFFSTFAMKCRGTARPEAISSTCTER